MSKTTQAGDRHFIRIEILNKNINLMAKFEADKKLK